MNKSIFDRRVLVAAGLAAGLGLSQTALAEFAGDENTASDELEITAGLDEALTLRCETALSFGITRLETGDRGGTTNLTVPAGGGAISVGGTGDGVSTVGNGQPGQCTISGSAAEADTEVTVTFETGESDSVSLGGDEDAFPPLDAPNTAADLKVSEFETDPGTVQIDGSGEATFNIGGTLEIPGDVVEVNLGGYRGEVTVVVNDDEPLN